MNARSRASGPFLCALLLTSPACDLPAGEESGSDASPQPPAEGKAESSEEDGDAGEDAGDPSDVKVHYDPAEASSWRVDRRLFGRFQEHNGRDIYPGLYAQHLANGSFETWFDVPLGAIGRTEELYRDEPRFEHIAYPWRPRVERQGDDDTAQKPSWEKPEGGVNGHANFKTFQRIYTHSAAYFGGVRQNIVLPDQRTREYVVRVHTRGTEGGSLRVKLEGAHGKVQAEETLDLSAGWDFHRIPLTLAGTSASRYQGHEPYGEYQIAFVLEDEGQADVDMAVLMSGDAIRGKYNPTTVGKLRAFGVTSMRWPGGNIASAYRWKDGIGPLHERPVANNWEWGGLEPNYFGTDEYLEFCEITGMEPFINIGFNQGTITPQEAAEWVEYVNGDPSTPMGSLRAENGHPEPYDVELWQIGNEVYGPYQIGHVDAETFAEGYQAYYDAMKEVDPSIRIIAAGIDPGYDKYGGNHWNEVLFERATERVEAIDIHRYVNGIAKDSVRNERDPLEYNQTLVAFPTQFEELIEELRASARVRGVSGLEINVGEWNLQPKVSRGWPRAGYPTMANAAFVAGMYNTFLRQSDALRYGYQRDNNLYFRPYPIDTRPVNPGSHTLSLYSEPLAGDQTIHHLPLDTQGPTFDTPRTGRHIRPTEDVPYVDGAGIVTASADRAYIYLASRDLEDARSVRVAPGGGAQAPAAPVTQLLQVSEHPFKRQTSWNETDGFELEERELSPDGEGGITVELPPASVTRLEIPLR